MRITYHGKSMSSPPQPIKPSGRDLSDEPLRIEQIRAVDLYQFYCSQNPPHANGSSRIPISRQRALAQAANPYADDHDVGLLVAFKGAQCVAYLGFLPGVLKVGDTCRKIHWFSGWFVAREDRHTSVGSLLLIKAFSLKYDFFITGLSRESERVLRALRLPELGPLRYYHLNLGWPVDLVTLPLRACRRLCRWLKIEQKWLENLIVACTRKLAFLKTPVYRWLLHSQRTYLHDLCYEEVATIDNGVVPPKDPDSSAVFYRGPEIINWMLRYKWVPEADAPAEDVNYAFLARQDVFKYIAVKVLGPQGKFYKGFIVMSVSSKSSYTTVRLLDFSFVDRDNYRCIACVMLKYAEVYRADRLEISKRVLPWINHSLLTKMLLRERTRPYFYHLKDKKSDLSECLKNIELHLYDSDQAFT